MPRKDIASLGQLETLIASAARTTTANGGIVEGFGVVKTIRAQLEVTAASGSTPTLDVLIEDTLDGTNFNTIGTFTQETGTGRQVINITGLFSDRVRVSWTITGGSASFTFSVILFSDKL